LEEGHELDADEQMLDQEEGHSNEPDPKRRRLKLENGDASVESAVGLPTATQAAPMDSNPPGLLTSDALEGLKYFSEIRKRHGAVARPSAPAPKNGLGLADYGSDNDD
jgi:hypothetical protein